MMNTNVPQTALLLMQTAVPACMHARGPHCLVGVYLYVGEDCGKGS